MMVKFTRSQTPYMSGETAAFPDERGRKLIAAGVAVELVTKPAAPEAVSIIPQESVVTKEIDVSTTAAEDLRAFLMERGVSVHHRTGMDKLREMAAAELAK